MADAILAQDTEFNYWETPEQIEYFSPEIFYSPTALASPFIIFAVRRPRPRRVWKIDAGSEVRVKKIALANRAQAPPPAEVRS
jgi:hypothetical protein